MADTDVLVVGGGPAGMLTAMLLADHGLGVSIFASPVDAPPPQAPHVHVISDATWTGLCALSENLEQRVIDHGAPLAPHGATRLQGELKQTTRAYPDRIQLDRAIRDSLAHHGEVQLCQERVSGLRHEHGLWIASGVRAPTLIDASGGARATLRPIARFAQIEQTEWGSRRGYASSTLNGVLWPADRIGDAARNEHGDALVARRVSAKHTRVTLQLRSPVALPRHRADFLERVAAIAPRPLSRMLLAGTVAEDISTWSSRRSSALVTRTPFAECPWMAIGDALLNTAPHMGQGLAQIVQQLRLVDSALTETGKIEAAANRTQAWLEQHVLQVTLGEHLENALSGFGSETVCLS